MEVEPVFIETLNTSDPEYEIKSEEDSEDPLSITEPTESKSVPNESVNIIIEPDLPEIKQEPS